MARITENESIAQLAERREPLKAGVSRGEQTVVSRRSLMRLVGLGGGLLLPFSGGGVLRLADTAAAAALPVSTSPFPVSPLVQRFREEARALFEIKLTNDNSLAHQNAHIAQAQELSEAAKAVIAQPVRNFADLRGLAEVAWLGAPKEELWEGRFHYTSKLYQLGSPPARHGWSRQWDWAVFASAALIEGVLTLTNGERFDPSFAAERARA